MATKSNYKNKPFNEWTEADFQAAEADRFAAWEKMREQDEREQAELEREIAEREAAEKQEG